MSEPTTEAGRAAAAKYRTLIESAWFEEQGPPVTDLRYIIDLCDAVPSDAPEKPDGR